MHVSLLYRESVIAFAAAPINWETVKLRVCVLCALNATTHTNTCSVAAAAYSSLTHSLARSLARSLFAFHSHRPRSRDERSYGGASTTPYVVYCNARPRSSSVRPSVRPRAFSKAPLPPGGTRRGKQGREATEPPTPPQSWPPPPSAPKLAPSPRRCHSLISVPMLCMDAPFMA